MKPRWQWIPLGIAALVAAGVGCTNDVYDPNSLENQRPVAHIFVEGDSLNQTSYNQAHWYWSGTDVDGKIVGFHVSIAPRGVTPTDWIFTTADETTATYSTDENGQAFPTLYVVAEDDRGALSDTVSTTFSLVNFPPTLEWARDFVPVAQSFGAATFQFLGFDLDGDETLLPIAQYRFEGSDPDVEFAVGDSLADPSVGWVSIERNSGRFGLSLRDIPPGDPANDWQQTLYVRLVDEAGGASDFSYTWQVFEVRGPVLVIDDNATAEGRDEFYFNALTAHLGDQFNVLDTSLGFPEGEDLRLALSQFPVVFWYAQPVSQSVRLAAALPQLLQYINSDLDPDTPGTQQGRLLIEYQYAQAGDNNVASFRGSLFGLGSTPTPRSQLLRVSQLGSQIGPVLDIHSQDPTLPDLGHNPAQSTASYFGLYGLTPATKSIPLYQFESARWGGSSDPTCRLGCEPIVATRWPATGLATVVLLGFQLDYANSLDNAAAALSSILSDHLGIEAVTP